MKKENTKKNTKKFFQLKDNQYIIESNLETIREQNNCKTFKLKNQTIIFKTQNEKFVNEGQLLKSIIDLFVNEFETDIKEYTFNLKYCKNMLSQKIKIKIINFEF